MSERGIFVSFMKRYATPGGWEVIHGHEWQRHNTLDLALVTAIEAVRFRHFDGKDSMSHENWILDYHFARRMRVRTASSRWRQRAEGTWHLYGPGVDWYQDSRQSKLPLHALWIRFHGGEKLGLRRLVDNATSMARIKDPGGWLTEHVRALAMLGDQNREDDYPKVLTGLTEIIYRLLHSQIVKPGDYVLETPSDSRLQDPLVTKVNEYLVAHLHETLTLSTLARTLHTSISTLHRRYAATSKESITQTLLRLRIARVKKLLVQGATVAEAAHSTGFYDAHHLSKTFRRLEGIPPRQFIYRLRIRKKK